MLRMIRKQVYLTPEQDQKLKRIAAQRGCTEARVLRDAIEALPEDTGDPFLATLRARGLLSPPPVGPPLPEGVTRDELEQRLRGELGPAIHDLRFGEAVLEERANSPW